MRDGPHIRAVTLTLDPLLISPERGREGREGEGKFSATRTGASPRRTPLYLPFEERERKGFALR